jgi:hypothetical protein
METSGVAPMNSIWAAMAPSAWPTPPTLMSYTVLREIETCPLRYGLRQGEYTGLWEGKGYPPGASAAIAGHIVHVALERIVRHLAANREARAYEPMALLVDTLRALGGISAVLEGVIREIVNGWETNPRLRPRAKDLASELQSQLSMLRARVQHFLNHVDLSRIRPGLSRAESGRTQEPVARPLAPGLHAEVPLVNDELGWYGKADLLRVSVDGEREEDEILDFKTGLPKPDHELQLRIYALLWAKERMKNPAGRRVRKLTLVYGSGSVNVAAPMTDGELEELAEDLLSRTSQARAAVQKHPPVAKPSRDACEWCDVRHMCRAYWAPETRDLFEPSYASNRLFNDVGVRILARQGSWSWVAVVEELGVLSGDVDLGARVLLRARPNDMHFSALIAVGARVRVLAAQFVEPSDESGGLAVLALTRSAEVFAVMESGDSEIAGDALRT